MSSTGTRLYRCATLDEQSACRPVPKGYRIREAWRRNINGRAAAPVNLAPAGGASTTIGNYLLPSLTAGLAVVRDLLAPGRLVRAQTALPRLVRRFRLVHHRRKQFSPSLARFVAFCREAIAAA